MNLAADIIKVLHIILVLFVLIIPFLSDKLIHWSVLLLHSVLVFGIVFHWLVNNDACFLTLLECQLRGIKKTQSFIHSLVSPVYKIDNSTTSKIVKIITPILGLITISRLVENWDTTIKNDIIQRWNQFSIQMKLNL